MSCFDWVSCRLGLAKADFFRRASPFKWLASSRAYLYPIGFACHRWSAGGAPISARPPASRTILRIDRNQHCAWEMRERIA